MKRIYRTKRGAKLAGICTGLGEVFNLDPVLMRVMFLILVPFGGIGIITYIVMWIVVPSKSDNAAGGHTGKQLTLSNTDRKVAGLCGGLGEYFNLDPTLFRVLFLVLLFMGGVGFLLYCVLWLVVPRVEGAPESLPHLA